MPVLAFTGFMTWSFAQSEKARLKGDVSDVNLQALSALERLHGADIAMMRVLATSPALRGGDIGSFRIQARTIVETEFKGSEFVLQDAGGKILIETGSPVKSAAYKAMLDSSALKSDRPTLSGILTEKSFADSAYLLTMPVALDGDIRYYIIARMPLQRLADLITAQNIDSGYFVSIVDRDGLLLARSAESEKHFGKELNGVAAAAGRDFFEWSGTNPQGVLVYGIIRREKINRWAVTTGISQELLHAPLDRSLAWLLFLAAVTFALGILLAFSLSRILSRAAQKIVDAAVELGEGKVVAPFATQVTEADLVGLSLKAASDKLRQQADALVSAKKTLERRVEERTEELAAKTQLLETTLANMDQGLLLIDKDGFIRLHNTKVANLIELPEELLRTQPNVRDTIAYQKKRGIIEEAPDDVAMLFSREGLVAGKTTVHERERPNGKVIEIRTVPIDGGQLIRTYTDVTLRKHAERHLQHLARHDPLTQLPNRLHFRENLEQALAYDKRHDAPFSVLFIDVDHFKTVNDLHGHGVGDALLREVSARFKSALRMEDSVSRFGGDEFAILQAGCDGDEGPAALARRLLKAVSRSYRIENIEINVSVSVGIATCPLNGISADEIMRRADTALYQAKRSGRNRFCQFEESSEILMAG